MTTTAPPTDRRGTDYSTPTPEPTPRDPDPLTVAGEWRQFRSDPGNTGFAPAASGPAGGRRYWHLRTDSVPRVADGVLYDRFHADTGEYSEFLSRDPATGAVERRVRVASPGTHPSFADGVAVYSTFQRLVAFDLEATAVRWRTGRRPGFMGTPTVADGTVFATSTAFRGTPSEVVALDLRSGAERWSAEIAGETKGTPAVAGGTAYVATEAGLYALDAATGEVRWRAAGIPGVWTSPTATDRGVVALGRDAPLVAFDHAGAERWHAEVVGEWRSDAPTVTSDAVYAVDDEGVRAFDRATGAERWTDPAGGKNRNAYGDHATVVADGGRVYVGGADGRLVALDVARGERLWSYRTEEVWHSDYVTKGVRELAVLDGGLYALAADGFHAFGPA